MNSTQLKQDLSRFTGTENYWKGKLHKIKYTDGIKFLHENAECYWLIDLVDSAQISKSIVDYLKKDYFQSIELKVLDNVGTFEITDGNSNVLYAQRIEFTDFPLDEIKLYLADGVLMLRSEY